MEKDVPKASTSKESGSGRTSNKSRTRGESRFENEELNKLYCEMFLKGKRSLESHLKSMDVIASDMFKTFYDEYAVIIEDHIKLNATAREMKKEQLKNEALSAAVKKCERVKCSNDNIEELLCELRSTKKEYIAKVKTMKKLEKQVKELKDEVFLLTGAELADCCYKVIFHEACNNFGVCHKATQTDMSMDSSNESEMETLPNKKQEASQLNCSVSGITSPVVQSPSFSDINPEVELDEEMHESLLQEHVMDHSDAAQEAYQLNCSSECSMDVLTMGDSPSAT